MVILKADTQVVVQFGPFLDKDDGVTLEAGITAASLDHVTTGIRISKNGGTFAARAATVTASAYDAHGMYKITLKVGDVDTEGVLRMVYDDATVCLPVWQDYMVVNANVYDSLYAADTTDYLQVDAFQLRGSTTSATDLQSFADDGFDPTTDLTRSNLIRINGVAAGASVLEQIANNAIPVSCTGTGSTTTVIDSALSSTDDAYIGRVFVYDYDTTTAALRGQAGVCTDYTGSTGTITFAASTFTTSGVSGDTGIIL